ncbi:HAD family hydrolase [Anaerocolumna xylanovorans]|uniref:Haloacid dehalogenase superfamily, subfamily IA, variant 3 with third motif having DD or ED n=1 Tax=Anaerocolumna xylanovorans DSM 12503 TaxID=1121345 RepID=A0A1M7YIJ7_9FIRM|nr:HAD family phosphatase [Anaerocolumna xylanovorans]SHO52442.1 haloacid dehalogenase superfamily, subfamily IA, variant 3 with third motif having DD or ED [Anaerocolumna xylanovorans DSM 12503]
MIRGVIFDVDGVLLDSMPMWSHISEWYLESLGLVPEKNLSQRIFAMSMAEGARYLKQQYAPMPGEEEILDGISKLLETFYRDKLEPKPGVKETLQWISQRKVPMIIATSSDSKAVEAALERLDIKKYFLDILTCTQIGAGKDRPDIYIAAQKKMNSPTKETIVVEDALHALRTASAYGYPTAGVYDEASGKDQTEIMSIADFYTRQLSAEFMEDIFRIL